MPRSAVGVKAASYLTRKVFERLRLPQLAAPCRRRSASSTSSDHGERHADEHAGDAGSLPEHAARHEASVQSADALEDPDDADDHEQDPPDERRPPHGDERSVGQAKRDVKRWAQSSVHTVESESLGAGLAAKGGHGS